MVRPISALPRVSRTAIVELRLSYFLWVAMDWVFCDLAARMTWPQRKESRERREFGRERVRDNDCVAVVE